MAITMKVVLLLLSVSSVFSAMPGAWEVHNNTDDKVVEGLALSAPVQLDKMSNDMYRHRLLKLVKVETKVVAGIEYRLTMEIGRTDCEKNKEITMDELEECPVKPEHVKICVATYYVQPWLKDQKEEGIQCHYKTQPTTTPPVASSLPHLLGGRDDVDTESDDAKRIANFAVSQLNAQSNSLRRLVLTDIRKVSRQTVEGTKWELLLELGESTCLKNRHNAVKVPENCADNIKKTSVCSVEVQERVWVAEQLRLLSHKCAIVSAENSLKITKPSHHQVTNMEQRPLLGGDGHDIGNYGSFQDFKTKYNKQYKNKKEEMRRFKIFRRNMKQAQKIQKSEKGDATYGATRFADMSSKEFRKYYLTPKWDISVADSMAKAEIPANSAVPDSWDWRDHGAVTPVKNQGQCGSCWAFSTTGNVEGQWALKKKKLLSLSEQELVDCDKVDQGCNGGLPANAYKAIEKLGGLETEKGYPYEAKGEKCAFKKSKAKVYINSSVSISSDEDDMKAWLYKNGPISIGINANAMQFYMGGVSHPWSIFCNPDNLDHGVLIVGYGTKAGWFGENPYWIVKNSWGPSWGEKGYYLVYRGSGVCGLNKMPTSAVIN